MRRIDHKSALSKQHLSTRPKKLQLAKAEKRLSRHKRRRFPRLDSNRSRIRQRVKLNFQKFSN